MAGEFYLGIPGLMGAAIVLSMLGAVARYVDPGPQRNGLILLVGAAFLYNLCDGLSRLAAASGDVAAAEAWFRLRFFGVAFVPASLFHIAGASTGLAERLWFRPTLALTYTASIAFILVRVGTPFIIDEVNVVNGTLSTTQGPAFRAFALFGLSFSLVASVMFFRFARRAPTTAARGTARLSGVAVLLPFCAAFANFFLTGEGTSPTIDPIGPFLTVVVLVFAGIQFARVGSPTTLSAIRRIFASLPDGILISDRRGLVVLANPAAATALGLGEDSLEGEPLRAAIRRSSLPEEPRDRLEALLGRVESGELPMSTLAVEVAGSPSRALQAVVGVAQAGGAGGLGGKLDAERDRFLFLALHEETEARAREILLSRANEVKDLFISMIGHDLKAPLNAISGYSELIAMDAHAAPDGLAVYKYAQSILASARQIQMMMENARLFSRLVDPQDILNSRERVDLPALVQREVTNLHQAAERRGVSVTTLVEPGAEGARVYAAPILRSVFQNIVDNAIKYTAEKTRVTVRVLLEEKAALVEVEDQGPGIPPEKREAVFRRFTRLEQTRAQAEGIGLGLAIARQLVELHGGSITVGARRDGTTGASFQVRLPLDTAPPRAPAGAGAAKKGGEE